MAERIRLGELLVRGGFLTEAQLGEVLESQRGSGRRLGEEIVARGLVDETQVTQMISNQLSIPWVSLYKVPFTRELLSLVPAEIADRHNLIPVYVRKVRRQGDTLFVALDDPEDSAALELVAQITGMPVKPMVSPLSEIRNAIRVYYFGLPPQTATTSSGDLDAISSAGEERTPSPEVQQAERTPSPEVQQAERTPSPDAASEVVEAPPPREEARVERPAAREAPPEAEAPRRATKQAGPKFVTMTLLDGTTVRLPVSSGPSPDGERRADERLTARDLVKALDARALGENTTDVLGDASWEALFSTLLSILLRKGLVADWEFVEEWQKHRPGSR